MANKEEAILNAIDNKMDELAQHILGKAIQNIARNGTWDTGFLARSGSVESKFLEKTIKFTAPYAGDIEFGSDPHYVPPRLLVNWARRKLRVPEKEAQSVAYAISKK